MKPSELLQKQSWCKHSWSKNKNGDNISFERVRSKKSKPCSFCIGGAMIKCSPNNKTYYEWNSKLANFLADKYNYWSGVANWNDEVCRSKQQAVKVLREAGL